MIHYLNDAQRPTYADSDSACFPRLPALCPGKPLGVVVLYTRHSACFPPPPALFVSRQTTTNRCIQRDYIPQLPFGDEAASEHSIVFLFGLKISTSAVLGRSRTDGLLQHKHKHATLHLENEIQKWGKRGETLHSYKTCTSGKRSKQQFAQSLAYRMTPLSLNQHKTAAQGCSTKLQNKAAERDYNT